MKTKQAKLLLGTTLLLTLSMGHADDSQLVGLWKGAKIQLNLKSNHKYSYKMKLLSTSGTWRTTGNKITLNYSIFGITKTRQSSYVRMGNQLTLTHNGKEATLIKQ